MRPYLRKTTLGKALPPVAPKPERDPFIARAILASRSLAPSLSEPEPELELEPHIKELARKARAEIGEALTVEIESGAQNPLTSPTVPTAAHAGQTRGSTDVGTADMGGTPSALSRCRTPFRTSSAA